MLMGICSLNIGRNWYRFTGRVSGRLSISRQVVCTLQVASVRPWRVHRWRHGVRRVPVLQFWRPLAICCPNYRAIDVERLPGLLPLAWLSCWWSYNRKHMESHHPQQAYRMLLVTEFLEKVNWSVTVLSLCVFWFDNCTIYMYSVGLAFIYNIITVACSVPTIHIDHAPNKYSAFEHDLSSVKQKVFKWRLKV